MFRMVSVLLVAALKTLPAHRPGATPLTEAETPSLEAAGLGEEPAAYAEVVGDILTHTARTQVPFSAIQQISG
jgi:hypothetical protein